MAVAILKLLVKANLKPIRGKRHTKPANYAYSATKLMAEDVMAEDAAKSLVGCLSR
jgi:hypothetical protein